MTWLVAMAFLNACDDPPQAHSDSPRPSQEQPVAPAAATGTGTLAPEVDALFNAPFETFHTGRVPGGHRIVVLSNLAEYCAQAVGRRDIPLAEGRRCTERLVQLGLHRKISPYKGASLTTAKLGDHGLFLSHLAVVLAADARLAALAGEQPPHGAAHKRIVAYLAARSLREPLRHVPSFPGNALRWPADQAVTLYAVFLYDALHQTEVAKEPLIAYRQVMAEKGIAPRWELPVSEITGRASYSDLPRGCALSWTTRYMSAFDPPRAQALWERYRDVYLVNLVAAAGFREWPPGVEREADVDSGPIVLGVGAAATGLGLVAARAVGDDVTYAKLRASREIVLATGGATMRAVGESILARSIELVAETKGPWWRI